jgi:hypothetical protein
MELLPLLLTDVNILDLSNSSNTFSNIGSKTFSKGEMSLAGANFRNWVSAYVVVRHDG